MHEFFRNIGPEVWLTFAVLINQGLSALRNWLSRKQISKNVKTIKDQVTPNGGSSMNDRLVKQDKKIDTIMRNQEAYFTVMMNNDNKAQARADHNGDWVFCNAALTDIFGMYHKDMLGKGWMVAIGSDTRERYTFVTAWKEYHKDRSPLNHVINITNQDTKQVSAYLVTAQDIIVDGNIQFHLIKFQKA